MTTRVFTPLHVVAATAGIACTAVECVSNVDHIIRQTKTLYDPAVAAVVVTSIGVTFAMACVYRAFREWQIITGVMLLMAFATGAAFTLSTTLDRVASHRDYALAKKWTADPQHQELVALLQKVQYMAARECGSGRGTKCDAISGEIKIAEQRLVQRRGELDSMGVRIAALIPGISPSTASLYQPMLLPVSLFLMGAYFVAFGLAGSKIKPEFKCTLQGRAALNARAERFADEFQATHGRLPKPAEIEHTLGVSVAVARRLHRDIAVS